MVRTVCQKGSHGEGNFGGIFAVGDEETNEEDKARVVNAYIY